MTFARRPLRPSQFPPLDSRIRPHLCQRSFQSPCVCGGELTCFCISSQRRSDPQSGRALSLASFPVCQGRASATLPSQSHEQGTAVRGGQRDIGTSLLHSLTTVQLQGRSLGLEAGGSWARSAWPPGAPVSDSPKADGGRGPVPCPSAAAQSFHGCMSPGRRLRGVTQLPPPA